MEAKLSLHWVALQWPAAWRRVSAKAAWANHHKSPTAAMMEERGLGLSQISFHFYVFFVSLFQQVESCANTDTLISHWNCRQLLFLCLSPWMTFVKVGFMGSVTTVTTRLRGFSQKIKWALLLFQEHSVNDLTLSAKTHISLQSALICDSYTNCVKFQAFSTKHQLQVD